MKPLCDNIILAGDIVPFVRTGLLERVCKNLRKLFKGLIIYVPGNHEYYTSLNALRDVHNMEELRTTAWLIMEKYGVKMLDNDILDVGNIRIIGSTLWSNTPPEVEELINDYKMITRNNRLLTTQDTALMHIDAVEFIEDELRKCKVMNKIPLVVTHHAPLLAGTSDPKYGDPDRIINKAFASDLSGRLITLEDEIDNIEIPSIWIFGHTHWSCDFMYGKTRIISNAKGYWYSGENTGFKKDFILTIG